MQNIRPQPLVSVIVPNYNHAAYLEERLVSITNQTLKNFELIVLDDASDDRSVAVIRHCLTDFPHKLIINESNSGSTFRQWDRGISLAQGELIWIAESDDVAAPTFLETVVNQLLSSDAALAYCQSVAINDQSKTIFDLKGWTDHFSSSLWASDFLIDGTYFARSFLAIKNVIPNASAVVFRRCLYVSPVTLGEHHKLGGDLLLWVKLVHGSRLSYTAEPLNRYRFHSQTVRKSRGRHYLSEMVELSQWILRETDAWNAPEDLLQARTHLANLWFSNGLEPASCRNWFTYKKAYVLLYRLHGLFLCVLLLKRFPVSLWRITLPQRLWVSLGWSSVRRKILGNRRRRSVLTQHE
jgi:glycosyltransferase involved in cell wall biosynthesis